MGRPLILAPDALRDGDLENLGGKAVGLLSIHRAQLRVPPWRVLPFDLVATRPWQVDETFREALTALLRELGGRVAVRSSAEAEDGGRSSHAGQFQTAFADSPEALITALDAVADSARGGRMAIILMQALAPECAGVAFSADPASAQVDRFYVEVIAGHGKQLVDGAATPLRATLTLDGVLEPPQEALAGHAHELARAMLLLEESADAAVDVEWAIAGGVLYFLQARPITALSAAPALRPATCHTSWFFDQRFLRPISPFTRTTLVPLILRAGVGGALAMRGRPADEARAYYYGGQAYLPHAVWRHMLDGAPRWFLSPDLRQLYPAHCACTAAQPTANAWGYAVDAARSVVRQHREVFRNVTVWRAFRAALPARIAAADALPTLRARWDALDALSLEFLAIHRWSILWADYAFRAFNGIAAVMGKGCADTALRAGMVLPTRVANAALDLARSANTAAAWREVLDRYGDRSPSLDYASPTWREIYPGTASNAGGESISPPTSTPQARGADLDAESASARTPRKDDRSAALQRWTAWFLTPIRRLLEMREEQRFHWEHILAAQRALALGQARAWARSAHLAREEEVWLLEGPEFFAALAGGTLPPPAELAARGHALRVEALIAKPLFLGPVEADAALRAYRSRAPFTLRGVGASAGRATGRVVHLHDPARGIPAGAPRPCILIVSALDPAQTGLLQEAAGIIAERGGLLSHAAILAREYRVPMVTALERAFALVPEGAEVEINGQSGTVRLLTPGK